MADVELRDVVEVIDTVVCQLRSIPGRVRISDVELRRQLKIPSIESQIRRARLRYAASLVKVAQPSVAALLGVEQRVDLIKEAPAPRRSA